MKVVLDEHDPDRIKAFFNMHPDTDLTADMVREWARRGAVEALTLQYLGELFLTGLRD